MATDLPMPTRETISIGSSPCEEDCVQTTDDNYAEAAQEECQRFIDLIRRTVGVEPRGAELFVEAHAHDFGTYYEVSCRFDPDNTAARRYALRCEAEAPPTWEDET